MINKHYILPSEICLPFDGEIDLNNVAVFIHLHYPDTVERYFKYLEVIPSDIDIYISSSHLKTISAVEDWIINNGKANISVMVKNNRGRDISALLVTFRDSILKYDYVCFVHDKKAKDEFSEQKVNNWIDNLWGNTLQSSCYIYNALLTFEKNKKIGLLVPPDPDDLCWNRWGKSFDNTKKLADKLKLQCTMDSNISPITMGTVFWCRTTAMKKLFEWQWQYEDFLMEPLPNDGTLGHAVERILSFVSEDAGFDTGILMTNQYAEKCMLRMQNNLISAFSFLNERFNIYTYNQLIDYNERQERVCDFFDRNNIVYLYGAGEVGRLCLKALKEKSRIPEGFIITKLEKSQTEYYELPVKQLSDLQHSRDVGIIITVSKVSEKEIIELLKKNNWSNYISYYE